MICGWDKKVNETVLHCLKSVSCLVEGLHYRVCKQCVMLHSYRYIGRFTLYIIVCVMLHSIVVRMVV